VPGAAFGDDRWVRLSYAASDEALKEGVDRLGREFARLAAEKAEVSTQKAG